MPASLSLLISYVGSYSSSAEPVLNIISFYTIAGTLLGGALVEYFSAILTDHTIDSAYLMAEEGERQLNIPGVLDGTVKPNYEIVISMAAKQALKKMTVPSVIALLTPIVSGLLFGPEFVGGLLIGATVANTAAPLFLIYHLF